MSVQVAVELLLVPECPHTDTARRLLTQCLDELHLDATVVERVGDFPSPTILVNGRDVAAYPFSGEPTAHIVRIDGGPTVYAMCAIDAPGIADMQHTRRTITDTLTECRAGQCRFQPPDDAECQHQPNEPTDQGPTRNGPMA